MPGTPRSGAGTSRRARSRRRGRQRHRLRPWPPQAQPRWRDRFAPRSLLPPSGKGAPPPHCGSSLRPPHDLLPDVERRGHDPGRPSPPRVRGGRPAHRPRRGPRLRDPPRRRLLRRRRPARSPTSSRPGRSASGSSTTPSTASSAAALRDRVRRGPWRTWCSTPTPTCPSTWPSSAQGAPAPCASTTPTSSSAFRFDRTGEGAAASRLLATSTTTWSRLLVRPAHPRRELRLQAPPPATCSSTSSSRAKGRSSTSSCWPGRSGSASTSSSSASTTSPAPVASRTLSSPAVIRSIVSEFACQHRLPDDPAGRRGGSGHPRDRRRWPAAHRQRRRLRAHRRGVAVRSSTAPPRRHRHVSTSVLAVGAGLRSPRRRCLRDAPGSASVPTSPSWGRIRRC